VSARFLLTALVAGLIAWGTFFAGVGLLARVCAQSWTTASVTSYHLERKGQNEVNPGLGFERPLAPALRAVGGGYVNSSSNLSLYGGAVVGAWTAGGARPGALGGPVRMGVLAALATGYAPRPVLIGGPVLSLEGREFGVNFVFIPAGRGVIGVQLKRRWD
jgi:hypothetical protein